MKKTIGIIAVLLFTIATINANEKIITENKVEINNNLLSSKIATVFDWTVTTDKSTYTGTSLNLEHARKMIALTSAGEIINHKKIESYYMLKKDINTPNNRLYFWEVISSNGSAKGFSSSEKHAQKIIALVAKGDIISTKIIISGIIK